MTKNDADDGGWNDMQIREFAKRFSYANRAAWHAYVPNVRDALIDAFVLSVVLGQDRLGIQVEEIRSLRRRLGARLAAHHRMPT